MSPRCFILSFKSTGLLVQEKKRKIQFQNSSHLGVQSERFKLFLINMSSRCFLPSFKSVGLLVQEKKCTIDFQDGGHLGCSISLILVIFNLQEPPMLPTKFHVNWSFSSGEDAKNSFSSWPPWRPLWISDRNDFDLQVTLMLPTKFQVKWPVGSGEAAKNRFSRWLTRRPSWISK